jgi:hypothetical protein
MDYFYEFSPDKSFCGLSINDITADKLTALFGEPSEVEQAENPGYGDDITIYQFNEHGFALFFNVNKLLNIAVSNPDFKLFGSPVFKMREGELIDLFKHNGFPQNEMDSDWGEKQLVFEDAGVTIFFDNQLVSEIFIDV